MILHAARISGFKSFRKPVDVFFSPRTTVLIGPNDHGKTNVLLAIEKLSPDSVFPVGEKNDRIRDAGSANIVFQLRLTDAELLIIESSIKPLVEEEAKSARLPGQTVGDDVQAIEATLASSLRTGPIQHLWDSIKENKQVEFVRHVGKPLDIKNGDLSEESRSAILKILQPLMPKIFLFKPQVLQQLPDTVNLAALESNEVMQGVFRLAGIWDSRERLLSGNTRPNQDELREASTTLTTQIRKNWTQGKDLEFYLEYVGNDVRLTVKDTAKTVTAISERSEGFTAYFAMRMLLVARTDQATPNGYLFMFDEPGLNLHPKGQVDLQNVFEDIARTNQIVYSTHSVFLINKNYPERNHLVFKNEDGSNIDNKPFVGGWARVKEHLGLYMSANFLFSDRILLVEGATDEIYLPSIIQGLIECGQFDGDLNALAIRSSINGKEMLALASVYLQEQRSVTVLVDGDEEGQRRKQKIDAWAKRSKQECPVLLLSEYKNAPCSIEDFLEPQTFVSAVLAACKQAVETGNLQTKEEEWPAKLKTLLGAKEGKSLGKRVEEATAEVFGEAISDVWIAIKYGEAIQAAQANTLEKYWSDDALKKLANALWTALGLPKRGDVTGIPFAG